MGEDFLINNTEMGDSVKTSQEFLYLHRELDSEKQVRCDFYFAGQGLTKVFSGHC